MPDEKQPGEPGPPHPPINPIRPEKRRRPTVAPRHPDYFRGAPVTRHFLGRIEENDAGKVDDKDS